MDVLGYIVHLLTIVCLVNGYAFPYNKDTDWFSQGKSKLDEIKNIQNINKQAKNVILFMGDGMGISTLTAARIYKGQLEGKAGEEGSLDFEKFPNLALSKTYNVDLQVGDSAATATAFLTGVKANGQTCGVNQYVQYEDCSNMTDINKATSILRWAQLAGKATGIVTTARITHATPASAYAHSPSRNWEGSVGEEGKKKMEQGCLDHALQLIHGDTGKELKVILGGGSRSFYPFNTTIPGSIPGTSEMSKRMDDRNLIQEWKDGKEKLGASYDYVSTQEELLHADVDNLDYLMGLFSTKHMDFEVMRKYTTEPSLTEMTVAALRVLNKYENGFVLLVEAGRIDHGHHDNRPKLALTDTVVLDRTVTKALSMTDKDETLTVVTADHSHVFTMGGMSPSRGNNILGLVDEYVAYYYIVQDNKTMTTLGYTNGPGAIQHGTIRKNFTEEETSSDEFVSQSFIPIPSETHGGEDVAIYAQGPMAHLFRGLMEQNVIAHIVGYASCIGDYSDCSWTDHSSAQSVISHNYALLYSVLAAVIVIIGNYR